MTLMSLPSEVLTVLVHWVANKGIEDLYPLMCVNKTLFQHVVPYLYKDPFRLCSRGLWKRSVYRAVMERQTKLIRTLLLCCTRTLTKVTPATTTVDLSHSPFSPSREILTTTTTTTTTSADDRTSERKRCAKRSGGRLSCLSRPDEGEEQDEESRDLPAQVPSGEGAGHRGEAHASEIDHGNTNHSNSNSNPNPNDIVTVNNNSTFPVQLQTTLPPARSLLQRLRGKQRIPPLSTSSSPTITAVSEYTTTPFLEFPDLEQIHLEENEEQQQQQPQAQVELAAATTRKQQQPPKKKNQRVELVPVVWDADLGQPETGDIPGLNNPTPKVEFPSELTKTVLRLAEEPAPIINYLSYVTYTDLRCWAAASNMKMVHKILGGIRPSWSARLKTKLKQVPRRLFGQSSTASSSSSGQNDAGAENNESINHPVHFGWDYDDDDDDDAIAHSARSRLNPFWRWRRNRRLRKREKTLWKPADVEFLEFLFLYYISPKIYSIPLGKVCAHWYQPSLDYLLPGVPERLSGLQRVVINHSATHPNELSLPQMFIERHQNAFPGQLCEIQARQIYHYSHDMSKSVLATIQAIKRLKVLDLSVWTGIFSGLDTICTNHLRTLLICHHMEIVDPHMFDRLLERCPVLEELSILVPHPSLFSWAENRKREGPSPFMLSSAAAVTLDTEGESEGQGQQRPYSFRRSVVSMRNVPQSSFGLPPLRNLTLCGQAPDVIGAFKDAIFAFQDTLESVQVSMYPDLLKEELSMETEFFVDLPENPVIVVANNNNNNNNNSFDNGLDHNVAAAEEGEEVVMGDHQSETFTLTTVTTTITTTTPDSDTEHEIYSSASVSFSPIVSNPPPPPPPVINPLSWDWTLPRLRNMSLRGPVVAYFDLSLTRYCPQLVQLALSLHCSRLPHLIFSNENHTHTAEDNITTSSWEDSSPTPRENRRLSTIEPNSSGAGPSSDGLLGGSPRKKGSPSIFPRILVCDSLAFKWGMTLSRDRQSM
ncbi:hypothetical protein BGZ83_010918, partial [Gryganskiella cystojenkinii]